MICGGLGSVANLAAGKFAEIGVYHNAGLKNCMAVTQIVGFVQPPFSDSPSLPAVAPYASCGLDSNHNKSPGQPAQVNYTAVFSSAYAKWCTDASYWPTVGQSALPFLTYYDAMVKRLMSLSQVSIPLPIAVEVWWPDGGACSCEAKFGEQDSVGVTGDAFVNAFADPQGGQMIPGFWGYLLSLHETVNTLTGQIGGGWPTDWWADHRSPFPNMMDEQVLSYLGTKYGNQTLKNAAAAQHERFADPTQSSYDSEVVMFDNLFSSYGGFAAFSRFFGLVTKDGLQWVPVAQDPTYTPDNNQSALLSEYVIAYLALSFGTTSDMTPTFTNAGVGTKDTKIQNYSVSSAAIKAIASAHCSIAAAAGANVNVAAQLSALQPAAPRPHVQVNARGAPISALRNGSDTRCLIEAR